MEFLRDQMVWYRSVGRGGYGYERKVPARVVKVFKTCVRICVGITDTPWKVQPVIINRKMISVKAYNLAIRDKECGFEKILKGWIIAPAGESHGS